MAAFWSQEYFDELVKTLNNSPEFKDKAGRVDTEILMVNKDRGAFLLTLNKGTAQVEKAGDDTKATFTFIGPDTTWVANHKGEAPMDKLVMTGQLKFKGSIPKIMGMRSQLGIIDKLAQSVPADDV